MSVVWTVANREGLALDPGLGDLTRPLELPPNHWRQRVEEHLKQRAGERALPSPFIFASLTTDLPAAVRLAQKESPSQPFTLVYNGYILPMTPATTQQQAAAEFRQAFGEDAPGSIPSYLSIGGLIRDSDMGTVFAVANAITFCKLTGRELTLAPDSYLSELKVGPDSELGDTLYDHAYLPGYIEPRKAGRKEEGALPALTSGALRIGAVKTTLLSNAVQAQVVTDLPREAVWELLRQHAVAVDVEHIQPAAYGFDVRYPDYGHELCRRALSHLALRQGTPGSSPNLAEAFRGDELVRFQAFQSEVYRLETIRHYYSKIDADDNAWVVQMFAPDAIYQRADSTITGIDAIRAFYVGGGRKIRGTHTLTRIEPLRSGEIYVEGRFEGTGARSQSVQTGFSDRWRSRDGLVTFRQTMLAQGAQYVKE